MIVTKSFPMQTQGDGQVIEISEAVGQRVAESGVTEGIVTVFVTGTTAGVMIMEHEPGLVDDFGAVMERLVPRDIPYQHNIRNNDDNGHSHTRACLLGPSLVVPVAQRRPLLGAWQRIVLVDFDSRPRAREVIVQVMGE